ncbi:MAG: UDP-N-acetylglucosamine--N-acetylmuramyl-(pentapeptide) pyrophosphoryl-undecaprenol N-acetylglucosamine transferase [Solirubrobacteraceae bacterium]
MSPPRIVIGAGGTAGHVVPALAVADALRAEGAEVMFIGGGARHAGGSQADGGHAGASQAGGPQTDRAQLALVPAAGYELRTIRVEPLHRRRPLKAAHAVLLDTVAVKSAWRILSAFGPCAAVGAGGYAAGPVGLAAVLHRVPLVLTEADSHLGLTNRLLTPFATRVCLAFEIPGRDGPRYRVTGRAVPPPGTERAAARVRFGIDPWETCVLVFGGSQGARSINHAAIEAFAGARFHVLHAAGERDLADLDAPGPHYDLRGYIPSFGEALLASDLVVARAGGSIFEIAAYGRPAVLIPYPHAAADHQTANARHMERAGAAVVIADAELSGPRLAQEVGGLLADRGRLTSMARACAALARPDAARDIAREVLAAAHGHNRPAA